jgi:hypothetical protein
MFIRKNLPLVDHETSEIQDEKWKEGLLPGQKTKVGREFSKLVFGFRNLWKAD